MEMSKNLLSRDFRRRSIFDFCNNIGDERNFLGPLMRFGCGDVRDLIVSHKTDHGPAHRRYGALQQWRCLKICFREIFGVVRFSTFATISALLLQ